MFSVIFTNIEHASADLSSLQLSSAFSIFDIFAPLSIRANIDTLDRLAFSHTRRKYIRFLSRYRPPHWSATYITSLQGACEHFSYFAPFAELISAAFRHFQGGARQSSSSNSSKYYFPSTPRLSPARDDDTLPFIVYARYIEATYIRCFRCFLMSAPS